MFVVELTWTDPNGDETSYRVEHRYQVPAGFSNWQEIAAVPADMIGYTHDDMNPIQAPVQGINEWRIRAERGGQFGPYSNALQLDLQPPALQAPVLSGQSV